MPTKSPFPDLNIPKTNILSYLFSDGAADDSTPIWIDSENPSRSLSPKQLLNLVKTTAAGLRKQGIRPGEVVAVFTPNHIFVPVVYLATVAYGAIFTGFNPAYTVGELVHLIKDSEAKVVFVHPSLVNTALDAARQSNLPKSRMFLFSDSEDVQNQAELVPWRESLGNSQDAEDWKWNEYHESEASSTVATINYSSGSVSLLNQGQNSGFVGASNIRLTLKDRTTGLPKGVMVSHSNIIANLEQTMFIRYHMTPRPRLEERWVGFLPLYHAYGQLYTILMACKLRIPVYIMESFHFEKFLSIIQRCKITNLQIAPPILVMLDKRPERQRYDLSSLREVVCGAAPIPLDLQIRIAKQFNLKFTIGWGMTELTCTGTSIPGGMIESTGSVGFLLPNSEAKVVDEDGKEVKTGERGEILYKGPNVCLGYWRNSQATQELFDADGWLRTGDIAIRDDRGLHWIVDRKKELIKVNGLQVAPAELEGRLLENEHVADAAVVGVNVDGNEYPRAYVALKPSNKETVTEAMIIEWLNSRVAKHKHLRGGVAFVDEIPKLASGKLQRKILRQWAIRDANRIVPDSSSLRARL